MCDQSMITMSEDFSYKIYASICSNDSFVIVIVKDDECIVDVYGWFATAWQYK